MYEVGQEITTYYIDAPLPPERRYQIGQIVDISDSETGQELAKFRVSYTDDTEIKGTIISITPYNKSLQPTQKAGG